MIILLAGLLIFCGVHAIPVWMPKFRAAMSLRFGVWPWKGVFALASFAGILVIIQGWQASEPVYLYDLGIWTRHLLFLIMPLSFLLFVTPNLGSNIRRLVRNQQYTAVKLWAFGHILANGDSRSLLLFGGLLVWAVLMVIGVKKRDGAYVKPEKLPLWRDGLAVVAALILTAAMAHFHTALIGVQVIPG